MYTIYYISSVPRAFFETSTYTFVKMKGPYYGFETFKKPAVACQPLSKFCRFTWVCFWTTRFKDLIISSNLEKVSRPSPHQICLHQRLIPPR